MLSIYIEDFLLPPSEMTYIVDVEEGFTRIIGGIPDTETNRKLLSAIDLGTYYDSQYFLDRFGCKQAFSNISTGCKAALCVANLTDCVISTIECGDNAITAILQHCTEGNIILPFNFGINTLDKSIKDIRVGEYHFTSLQRLHKYLVDEFPDEPDLSIGGVSCLK